MGPLLKRLKAKGTLVSDGAWGTFLYQKGLQAGDCPELWNIEHRADVLEVAQSYVDAGCDTLLTNSFGGSPIKLAHYQLQDRCAELNRAAAEISCEAAGDKALVLGSIGPTGAMLITGEVTEDQLYEGFSIQAEALKAGGAQAMCVETMSDITEASLAVKAAREASGLEVVCTFTFNKGLNGDYRTMMGVSPEQMVQAMKEAGAEILGSNCGNGFDQMVDIVQEIRKVDSTIPLLVHANAGLPQNKDGETVYPDTPDIMASKVKALLSSGANIIGGCCGTSPEHIRRMVAEVQRLT